MFYTYIIHSLSHPNQYYTGHTADLRARLAMHNEGTTHHTAKYRPWEIEAYFAFKTEELARNFETYLKSGSGRAFSRRHFRPQN